MRDYAKNFKPTTDLKQPNSLTSQKKINQYNVRKISLSLILVLLIMLFMMSFNDKPNPAATKMPTSDQTQLPKNKQPKQEASESIQQADQTPSVEAINEETPAETAKATTLKAPNPALNGKAAGQKQAPIPLQFTFYDTLTQKSVTVDATPTPIKHYRYTYMLQVGSYREPSHANATRAKLILAGLKPTVNKIGEWYRIDVGPVYNKRDGDIIKHKVETAGISGSILRQVDKEEIPTKTLTNVN